jgi:cysteine desulfurase
MLPYLGDLYANPSSAHGAGMAVKQAMGQARGNVAGLIGAKPAEITFTASATEANHLAILFRDLAAQGYHVTILPVDGDGRIRRHDLASVVSSDTALVSVMWANNV